MIRFDAAIPADVLAAAQKAAEVPWEHLGRSAAGVDCVGCAQLVYSQFGIDCRLPTNYLLRWFVRNPNRIIDHVESLGWKKLVMGSAVPLDVLIFSLSTRRGDHIGVFIGEGRFVHCWTDQASIVSLTDQLSRSAHWLDRLVAVYRPI